MKIPSELVGKALELGAKLEIDLSTGEAKVSFRQEDYTREEWKMIVDELVVGQTRRRRHIKQSGTEEE